MKQNERPMTWTVAALTPAQLRRQATAVIHVYREAFRLPPYEKGEAEVASFALSLREQPAEPGFKFVAGFPAGSRTPAGFCYGRDGAPHQLWYQLSAERLRQSGLERWLSDVFQVTELAVHPAYQRLGLGSRLLDELLASTSCPRAVLATMAEQTPAYRLYLNRGWQVLLTDLVVPGLPRQYQLLSLDLRRRRSRRGTMGPVNQQNYPYQDTQQGES